MCGPMPVGDFNVASALGLPDGAVYGAPMGASSPGVRPAQAATNRWAVLALLSTAQLMVVLDATIVNVALPSAQADLHFSTLNRQWVVTAYSLAFGSLLLLGGKLGDLFGRKWTFIAGLVGFSMASVAGGLADSFVWLVVARAAQGAFAALLAPSALSLLTVTFAGSPERPRAFGVFAAVAAGGGAVGLLLGGVLTQLLSWRWCLYVNAFIAVPVLIASRRVLPDPARGERPYLDVPGTVTVTFALFALVYGFSSAETSSWSSPVTILALAASPILAAVFVAIELRSSHPLLPLHIVANRARGGAYFSILVAGMGVFATFLFLTYYLQSNLGFSPLRTGLAFLPMTAAVGVTSSTVQTKVLPRTGAKPLIVIGMCLGVLAMLFFTRLPVDGSYLRHVLPGLLVFGMGMGLVFAPAFGTATLGVDSSEAGVASAMVNTSQQVGGSIGTSLLSTVYATAVASYASSHAGASNLSAAAVVSGYTTAFAWSAGIFVVGLIIATLVLPSRRRAPVPTVAARVATHWHAPTSSPGPPCAGTAPRSAAAPAVSAR